MIFSTFPQFNPQFNPQPIMKLLLANWPLQPRRAATLLILGAALWHPASARANTAETQMVGDATGTSSLIGTTNWTPATTVAPTNILAATYDYATTTTLRTPAATNSYTLYANSLTLNTGGALGFKGSNVVTIPNLILNGGSIQQSGTAGIPDIARLAGSINLTASSTIKLGAGAGTNALDIMAVITNSSAVSANLTVNTAGMLILSAPNTFNGNISVANNTTTNVVLQLGINNALPATAGLTLNGGSSGYGPMLDLNGYSTTISNLTFSSGAVPGIVTNTAPGTTSTLALGYNNANETLTTGVIADNPATAGTISLTKVGNGTLTLGFAYPYSGDTTVSAGTLKMGASSVLPNGAGKGNLTVNGTLDMAGRGETVNGFSGTGTVDNSGGLVGTDYTLNVGNNDASSTFGGVIQNTLGAGNTALGKRGLGTLTLTGNSTYTGATTILGGTLAVNGTLAESAVTVSVNGTLAGSGILGSNVTVNGTIAPGSTNLIGGLTCSNGVTLAGTTWLKLNRTGSPAKADSITAATLTLGGTLTVTNIGGTLQAGDTFTVFNSPGLSGMFSVTNLPPLASGLAWDDTTAVNGKLTVVSTGPLPQPVITSVSLSGSSLIFSGTNGTAGQSYTVLSSTNLTVALTNWIPVVTNTFGAGSFSITNTVVPGAPQKFYIMRIP